jgi:hypothetical protein
VENGELNDWILMEDFLLIQATSADATRDTLMQALRRKKGRQRSFLGCLNLVSKLELIGQRISSRFQHEINMHRFKGNSLIRSKDA